ncbi:hypothetical protein JCM30237_12510 [Halolamina litorea]|uniref:Uncharacterized protein n=1 Tax=Halolamina litorea TaxID=1515593 RepID=A0ABD6BLK6_9EURY|nr:hypothetical protein [Halolamina litorea]
MASHFEDARYYMGRAVDHAKAGVREEVESVEQRVRKLTGTEKEPEPGRLEKLQADLQELEGRAEGEAREAVETARERLTAYREKRSE